MLRAPRRVLRPGGLHDARPQHYWEWNMSHGFRGSVESPGPELAAEFKARLLAGLEDVHANGGITVDARVAFDRVRKPATPP